MPGPTGAVGRATISVFDLVSVGIGPASSRSAGPIRVAAYFVDLLRVLTAFHHVIPVNLGLYGSSSAPATARLGLEMATTDQDCRLVDDTVIVECV